MTSFFKFDPTAALMATAIIVTASSGFAAMAQERSVQVRFDDFDLANKAGQAVLDGRIKRALDGVCGSTPTYDLGESQRSRSCRR